MDTPMSRGSIAIDMHGAPPGGAVTLELEGERLLIAPEHGDDDVASDPSLRVIATLDLQSGRYRVFAPDVREPAPKACIDPASPLTRRESEIAMLVAEGLLNKQIADRLQLSVYTVGTHLQRMFVKLGVHNRTALAHRVRQMIGAARE